MPLSVCIAGNGLRSVDHLFGRYVIVLVGPNGITQSYCDIYLRNRRTLELVKEAFSGFVSKQKPAKRTNKQSIRVPLSVEEVKARLQEKYRIEGVMIVFEEAKAVR